jgi:hypothetical protein
VNLFVVSRWTCSLGRGNRIWRRVWRRRQKSTVLSSVSFTGRVRTVLTAFISKILSLTPDLMLLYCVYNNDNVAVVRKLFRLLLLYSTAVLQSRTIMYCTELRSHGHDRTIPKATRQVLYPKNLRRTILGPAVMLPPCCRDFVQQFRKMHRNATCL